MITDINKIINDLWHASINNFEFSENNSKNWEKCDRAYIYKNEINKSTYIIAKINIPWVASRLFDELSETVISINIVINNQTINYTNVYRKKYETGDDQNFFNHKLFRKYFKKFLNNIRLFNWEA